MGMENIHVPRASPEPLPELETFLRPFLRLFRRKQTVQSMERYVTGLLTDLQRKNCETIAEAVAGTSIERLQHLLTDAKWEAEALNEIRVRELAKVSPRDGILILDDTSLPKKGSHSPGVARQYCGALGKIGNCQVIVTAEYSADEPSESRPLHWPVSARLYLPKAWVLDRERRSRAHIPEDLPFRTKLELALELVDRARAWQVPFKTVVADAGYGSNPNFLTGLEERQVSYVCGVERSFGLRLPDEVQAASEAPLPEYQGIGRPRLPRPAPLHTAEALSQAAPQEAWQPVAWRDGTRKTLCKQFVAIRAHRATGNPAQGRRSGHSRLSTGSEGWLLAERPLPGQDGDVKWYYSNLPADTPLERLVTLAHSRWLIERFYQDAKGECGLRDFQGRRWDGLHRHLALVMLTYSFLMRQGELASQGSQGGLSPLQDSPDVPSGTSESARVLGARLDEVAHSHQPDRVVPPSSKLTE
jgi:SRSO17 transposase